MIKSNYKPTFLENVDMMVNDTINCVKIDPNISPNDAPESLDPYFDKASFSSLISIALNEGDIIKIVPVKATPIQTKRKGDTFSLIKYPEKRATNNGDVHCKTTAVVRGIRGIA